MLDSGMGEGWAPPFNHQGTPILFSPRQTWRKRWCEDFTELTVQVPDTDCRVTVHLNRGADCRVPLREGQDVSLRWEPCHCNVLTD